MKFHAFIIFCVSLTIGSSFAQNDDVPSLRTYYKVVYEERPDSLYLDEQTVPFENEQTYKIKPGVYEVRAVKECYKPLIFNTRIRENHQKLIRLDFERYNTTESVDYKLLNIKDYGFTMLGVGAGFLISNNYMTALPISLIGFLEHFLWRRKIANNFNDCTAIYTGTDYEKSNIRFSGGVNSSPSMESEITTSRQFIRRFDLSLPINIRYNTDEMFRIFSSSDFLASYSLIVGVEADIFSNLSTKLSAVYYPFVNVEYIAKYHELEFSFNRNHPLFMIEMEFNLPLMDALDQKFSISFGGFMSNIIKGSFELPLLPPDRPPFEDSTAIYVESNYSYQVIGAMIGLRSDYYISNNFSLYYQYLMNFGYKFDAIGLRDESYFYSVKVGFSWEL